MKVVSSKKGSSRERVDAQADLLDVANWRIAYQDADRHIVLSSRWGAERSTELWLTEAEAIAVARAVTDDLLKAAAQTALQRQPLDPRVLEMRNAIDILESAMMGLGNFVDLPRIHDGARDEMIVTPHIKLGEVRRVCEALSECTRIINSDDYTKQALSVPEIAEQRQEVADGNS